MSAFYSLIGFGLLTQAVSAMPFVLLILPITFLFRIRLYTLNKKEDCLKLQAALKNWTNTLQDGRGCGYSLSWSHYCHLSIADQGEYSAKPDSWLLCTEETFKLLLADAGVKLEKEKGSISVPTYSVLFKSTGTFSNTYYCKGVGELQFQPRKNQTLILERLINLYKARRTIVAFISGPPNTGKSMIGVFLSYRLGGVYCNEFTPWIPGDSLSKLKQEHESSKESPLVISMDAVDDAIIKIAGGLIKLNETTMTNTSTKNGWNTLFDNIERGMYPNTILILTSNQNPSEIAHHCGGDSSYLRDNRITEFFELQ